MMIILEYSYSLFIQSLDLLYAVILCGIPLMDKVVGNASEKIKNQLYSMVLIDSLLKFNRSS